MTRKFIQTRNYVLWNYNTKEMKANLRRYKESYYSELWEVYGNYSSMKINAMRYCHDVMNELEGWGLRIISHNTMVFTVGFLFNHPETGVLCMAYITRDYDKYIEVE